MAKKKNQPLDGVAEESKKDVDLLGSDIQVDAEPKKEEPKEEKILLGHHPITKEPVYK